MKKKSKSSKKVDFKAPLKSLVKKETPSINKKAVSTAVVIADLEKRAKNPEKKLQKVPSIKNQADLDIVGENVKLIKELSKEATTQEEKITGTLKEAIKKIKGSIGETEKLFAPFQDKMLELETNEKLKISIYLAQLDKAKEKLEEDMESGKIKKVSTYTDKAATLSVSTGGNFKARDIKELEIDYDVFWAALEEGKISKEFVIASEPAIKAAIKDGLSVPGCKMVKKKSIAV